MKNALPKAFSFGFPKTETRLFKIRKKSFDIFQKGRNTKKVFMQSRFLDISTVKAIKANMHWRDWLPFLVSNETGLRIGDVLALRWCNVEPDGHVKYMAKKTGKIGETIISPHTLMLIKNAYYFNKGQWLFPGRKEGKHLTRQTAWYRIKKACERAKIDASGISPHSFRKVFAVTQLHASGGDINSVKKALQHDGLGDTALYAFSDRFSR